MFRVRIQALWGKSKSNHNANKHDRQMHTNIAERTRSDRERENTSTSLGQIDITFLTQRKTCLHV